VSTEADAPRVNFVVPQRMITPIDLKVEKVTSPEEGDFTLISFVEGIVTPGGVAASQVCTFKIGKEASDELAVQLTGGVQIARADELPFVKP
jgi:hypothetical protein